MEKKFDTIHGEITCRYCFDADTSMNGEGDFEMYDEDGGYYGTIYGVDEDELTAELVEEQIEENLYYA